MNDNKNMKTNNNKGSKVLHTKDLNQPKQVIPSATNFKIKTTQSKELNEISQNHNKSHIN